MIKSQCVTCNKSFISNYKKMNCSRECYSEYMSKVKKQNNVWSGKKHDEETKQKISFKHIGKHKTEEHKMNIGLANKGKIVTKETRKKMSDIVKKRINEGSYICPNKFRSIDSKKKCSESQKKRFKGLEGILRREQSSINASNNLKKHKYSDTIPEKKMKKYLIKQGLKENKDFIHQHQVKDINNKFVADFYIPKLNTIIECDGNYWHNYPNGNEIDHIRTEELKKQGYNVLRFWESQIKKRFDEIQKVLDPIIQEV